MNSSCYSKNKLTTRRGKNRLRNQTLLANGLVRISEKNDLSMKKKSQGIG
jgi:hypothetical protein